MIKRLNKEREKLLIDKRMEIVQKSTENGNSEWAELISLEKLIFILCKNLLRY